jgi:hypothetical protein
MEALKIVNPVEQVEKMPTLKDTYGFVSSRDLITALESKGWFLNKTDVTRVRKESKQGYQKHLMRFRHASFPSIEGLSNNNKSIPEIVVVNSHDGTTALRMMLGLYRLVCSNGLMVGTSINDFRVIHSGDITKRVGEGIEFLAGHIEMLTEQVRKLQNSAFTQENLQEFVNRIVSARLSYIPGIEDFNFSDALAVTRSEDQAQDAFTVMNRVQERIMRGGISYTKKVEIKDEAGNVVATEYRNGTTRRLRSVSQQVKLNRLVYDTAMELAAA